MINIVNTKSSKFKTYEEAHEYFENIFNREYLGYLDAVKCFIKSDKRYQFSAECFAETIVNEIVGGN